MTHMYGTYFSVHVSMAGMSLSSIVVGVQILLSPPLRCASIIAGWFLTCDQSFSSLTCMKLTPDVRRCFQFAVLYKFLLNLLKISDQAQGGGVVSL
jgi:hypothetical protein